MIDRGLLVTGIVVALVTAAFPRLVRGPRLRLALDPLFLASVTGVLVARLVAVAAEDPAALGRVRDVLVIRGGVAFWPGVAGGAAMYAYLTRGSADAPLVRVSAAAPTALAGYGAYEATCIIRDGCFGPTAEFGLVPPGFLTPMLPVAWLVAIVMVAGAVVLQRRSPRGRDLLAVVLLSAAVRSVASFHLPRVGSGLTTPHLQSLVVAVVALALTVGLRARERHTTPSRSRPVAPTTTDE